MHVMDALRNWNEPLIDEWAEKLGAKCTNLSTIPCNRSLWFGCSGNEDSLTIFYTDVRSDGVWDDFHVADDRVVTGMNPQSAKATAEAAVRVLERL